MKDRRLFSVHHATAGAFLGGPVAALVLILSNYRSMGNQAGARWSLIVGGALSLACLLVAPFLPDNFPKTAIPIATAFVTWLAVKSHQSAAESLELPYHSVWRALAVSALSLVVFFAIGFLYVLALLRTGNLPAA